MEWHNVKKYKPSGNITECLVATKDGQLYVATNDILEDGTCRWVCDDEEIQGVTHFVIPKAIEIEE